MTKGDGGRGGKPKDDCTYFIFKVQVTHKRGGGGSVTESKRLLEDKDLVSQR